MPHSPHGRGQPIMDYEALRENERTPLDELVQLGTGHQTG